MIFKSKILIFSYAFLLVTAPLIFSPYSCSEEKNKDIKAKLGFYYTIQKGDTLWDLSHRFSDSTWLWPDLWQKNSQLYNPHRIYPGQKIRLLLKETKMPKLQKKKKLQKKIELIPPKEKNPFYYYAPINSVGFIRKKQALAHGKIIKPQETKKMISTGDKVYIKTLANKACIPGDKFTVYRIIEPVIDKQTNKNIGIQHYLTGIIEIIKKEEDSDIAIVIESFKTIKVNDYIMPFKYRSPEISLIKSKTGLKGKIILAEEHNEMIGTNYIAFVDKGSNDVKKGQLYSIYYQDEKYLDPATKQKIFFNPVDFGILLVLHTEHSVSTVIVLKANKNISPGEKIHTPKTFSSLKWP